MLSCLGSREKFLSLKCFICTTKGGNYFAFHRPVASGSSLAAAGNELKPVRMLIRFKIKAPSFQL